ncbi:MAG: phosphoenolpyruvate synthase [Candidatus Hodarchaeota archaeon]
MKRSKQLILWFDELSKKDIALVGGKAANLGELASAGAPTPEGFAVSSYAYKRFIEETGLDKKIHDLLKNVDISDLNQLEDASKRIRELVESSEAPPDIQSATMNAYEELARRTHKDVEVSVRSSATAEDLPGASFAGQQDTFLYVTSDRLTKTVLKCWSSLFTARAIYYRSQKGFDHFKVLMSVIVQEMVAPNPKAQGVIFTIHPVTGDPKKILIESNYGLGEAVVSGSVTPDAFIVDKDSFGILTKNIGQKKSKAVKDQKTGKVINVEVPKEDRGRQSITDEQIVSLAKIAEKIENHYDSPMDIEWAIDENDETFILQARPETVWSSKDISKEEAVSAPESLVEGEVILKGLPVSPGIGIGSANVIMSTEDIGKVREGDILVTKMTTPSWVPAMQKSAAIVTEDGGYTCHAAIVSRELGVPCIVGARKATKVLKKGEIVTVDGKKGLVYRGRVEVAHKSTEQIAALSQQDVSEMITSTKIYVNLSIPEIAEKVARETRADGVGLLRAEHLMLSIGKHPRRLVEEGGAQLMIDKFAEGIRKVAEAFYPNPVIYRTLDFKPDEFLALEGGTEYEEEAGHVGPNPMIGYRGQFRYVKEPDIFRLELKAIKKVRDEHNFKNVYIMLPFVRTLRVFKKAKQIIKEEGLDPEEDPDFKLWIMVEVPSSVFIIDKLIAEGIQGVSVGSNDLTMLILGADRNDASVQELFDERDIAVLRALVYLIKVCKKMGITVSICGQAPSVYPEYAELLVRQGVTSISVNPDVVIETRKNVAQIERKLLLEELIGKTKFSIAGTSEDDFEFWKILEE